MFLRDFFHKSEPINLTNKESEIEKMLPRKGAVVEGDEEPISSSEIRGRASEELEVSKKTVSQRLRRMNHKGVVYKPSKSQWISKGRTRKVIDTERLTGLFIIMILFFVILGINVNSLFGYVSFLFAFIIWLIR